MPSSLFQKQKSYKHTTTTTPTSALVCCTQIVGLNKSHYSRFIELFLYIYKRCAIYTPVRLRATTETLSPNVVREGKREKNKKLREYKTTGYFLFRNNKEKRKKKTSFAQFTLSISAKQIAFHGTKKTQRIK